MPVFDDTGGTYITLTTPSPNVCNYDRIHVSWSLDLEDLSSYDPLWSPPIMIDLLEAQLTSTNPKVS